MVNRIIRSLLLTWKIRQKLQTIVVAHYERRGGQVTMVRGGKYKGKYRVMGKNCSAERVRGEKNQMEN